MIGRRALLKGTAMVAVAATARAQGQAPPAAPETTLADAPLGPSVTITVERRGDIVLVGFNRPSIQNRLDPPTRTRLAETFYQYEHDPSLRALVLFGHGETFSRGIDVDASQAGIIAGQRAASTAPTIDVLGNGQPRRSKPVVVVVHGDTWNLGHEIYLAGDVRVAAAATSRSGGRSGIHCARDHPAPDRIGCASARTTPSIACGSSTKRSARSTSSRMTVASC